MMKRHLFAAAVSGVTALGLASTAQAAVIATVTKSTPTPNAFATPGNDTAFTSGYSGWIVRLSTTGAGELISAVDFAGVEGFDGPIHQRWTADADEDGNADPNVFGTSTTNTDSHFLGSAANVLVVAGTSQEDNTGAGSPIAGTGIPRTGMGATLQVAYGIPGAGQSGAFDLAYLVVPNNSEVPFSGRVSTNQGTFDVVGIVNAQTVVPEPATLGMLGMAALGLLARRRKA